MKEIWDCHVHLFPERLFTAIWRWFDNFGWRIPYAYWTERQLTDYLQSMGVTRAFLLTYAHKADVSLGINRWVKEFCSRHPQFVPFACIHPGDRDLAEIMATVLDDWGFAGFKLQLAVQGFSADDPGLEPIYKAAAVRGKPVIVHAGTAPYSTEEYPFLGIKYLRPVLDSFPDLKVVLPHLGLYEMEETFDLLAKYPKLYLDTSWVLGNDACRLDLEAVKKMMVLYPDRFLYGSDFPIMEHDPQDGLRALAQLELPAEVYQGVVCENACKLIGENKEWC